MVLQRVQQVPLPFIISGDFNLEPDRLPIWGQFEHLGCKDLIGLHTTKYGYDFPATCQGSTRTDNAIVSSQLIPFIGHITVIDDEWFSTHSPVFFDLHISQPQLFVLKYRMPKSWVELGLTKEQIDHAVPTASRPHPTPNDLQQWAENFEAIVDQAIRLQHRKDVAFPSCLPRSHRGRCRPRNPIKHPVFSGTKPARVSDFEPCHEVITITTRRKVKQVRRIQSLLRRLQHADQQPQVSQRHWFDMHTEWMTILQCKCFRITFCEWIAHIPELGFPPYHLPTIPWLHDLHQMVTHVVTSEIARDYKVFTQKREFAKYCDARFQGSKQAFAQVRPPPPPQFEKFWFQSV